jgi:chemotaxis protein MotB
LLVQGLASSNLFVPAEPQSPTNRRISIIVMNQEAEDRLLKMLPNQGETDAAAGSASTDPATTSPAPARPPALAVR